MNTNPNQNQSVFSIVTESTNGSLKSVVVMSRPGMTRPVENITDDNGRGIKVVLDSPVFGNDFVVRSVVNGQRRHVEVLAGEVPMEVARLISAFAETDNNLGEGVGPRPSFVTGERIDLTDGDDVAEIPGTYPAGYKNVFGVVTYDHDGAVVSHVYASRPGYCRSERLDHETGRACKVIVDRPSDSDFVVRSVVSGRRRKVEVLSGVVSMEAAQRIPGFYSNASNLRLAGAPRQCFVAGECIELAHGRDVAVVEGVRVNAA